LTQEVKQILSKHQTCDFRNAETGVEREREREPQPEREKEGQPPKSAWRPGKTFPPRF
jgi:hypothetical protein